MIGNDNYIFNEKAVFIWGANSKTHEWWMFRKEFYLDNTDIMKEAIIYLTSGGQHVLYINGNFVARGPARSYPFAKSYDAIEISRFLKKGNNIILIVSVHIEYGAIIAKLCIDNQTILYTDDSWKSKLHPCFDLNTIQNNVPLEPIRWIEERYDNRLKEDWHGYDYDDKTWPFAVELGRVGEAPFDQVFKNKGGLLSEDIILPKKYEAIEWAEDRVGYFFRFDRENSLQVNIYLTEVISDVDCEMILYKKNTSYIYLRVKSSLP